METKRKSKATKRNRFDRRRNRFDLIWYIYRTNITNSNKKRANDEKTQIMINYEYITPAGTYLLKVNERNTRTRCEICSKLTIKTPERRQWRC